MSGIQIGLVTFLCLLGGALVGVFLHPLLPGSHRTKDTQRVVKRGIGMLITVAALVLSLLTYSVKTSFDNTETNVRAFAADIVVLDRSLRAYGPEAAPARALLRRYTTDVLHSTWPEEFGGQEHDIVAEDPRLGDLLVELHDKIRALDPQDAVQREAARECLDNIHTVVAKRFDVVEQIRKSIPPLMLWGVVAWLTVIFTSFGRATRW